MGFDALFFGRMDIEDYNTRIENKELQWVWMPNSDSKTEDLKIFTHKMWDRYGWNPGPSNFDMIKNDEGMSPETAEQFVSQIIEDLNNTQLHNFRHKHIFQQWGDDFNFMNAFFNFENLDYVINYANEHYGDKFFFKYSTPSEYIDTISKLQIEWPTKYDDLFPYSDKPGGFWTGYFTSRANLKAYIKRGSSYTHASNSLYTERVLAQDSSETEIDKLLTAKYIMLDAMGINQHHDAVTGTAKQAVTEDYYYIMSRAIEWNSKEYSF